MLIGSHVRNDDPLAAAQADGADVVQFFPATPSAPLIIMLHGGFGTAEQGPPLGGVLALEREASSRR
ncbi:endonuclease IV [Mycobacterium bohemicum DSM 44277]|uniref:Uncharacterized protein n=2 Tax=Mycobacterium bohemicum TaxID=56425 RepID=A0A1X1RC98_MYCBE|nr:hypothetical protein AWB93_03000 [Mycobacterium bohemicum]CPR11890.1 endonuclease IV [Mycobacterium bohemicum DSM 44277]